jgi:hypothetical protein
MTCHVRDARSLVCNFCKRQGTRKSANRLLLVLYATEAEPRVIAVHKFCADLNSGHGGEAYNPEVVWTEYQRARQLKCALCGESGASAGCELDECPKSYHAQCALEHPDKVEFCSNAQGTALVCLKHRSTRGVPRGGPLMLPPPAPRPPAAPKSSGGRGPAKRGRSGSAGSESAGEGAAANTSVSERF